MKHIGNLAILATAALLVACNKEKLVEPGSNEGAQVHFDMTIGSLLPMSRTITGNGTDGNRSVAWRRGDAAGIFVNDGSKAHQYVYEAEGDGIWKEASKDDAIYAVPSGTYSFYSYYPFDAKIVKAASSYDVEASVLADQSAMYGENTGYDLSDLLLAAKTGVTGTALAAVEMQYAHAFSMVEVFVGGSEVTAAPESVTLKNVKRAATVDLAARTALVKADAAAEDVVMCRVESYAEDGGYLYRAIVPGQTVAAGDRLLEVELAEKSYYFMSPEGGVTYNAAKYRRIEATIGDGKAGLEFPAGSIEAWEPSDDVLPPINGEEKPLDLVDIRIADLTAETFVQSGNAATYLHDQANTASFINETCWTMSTYTDEDIIGQIVDEDGAKAIRLYSGQGVAFSFFKSGIRYHHVGEFKPGYYRMEITMKKSADCAAKDLSVFIRTDKTAAHSWAGIFFSIKDNDGKLVPRTLTDAVTMDWMVDTIYLDMNQAFSTAYSSAANEFGNISEDSEAYDYFDLSIMPNGGGKQDFYIRDVKLIKVSQAEFDAQ